MDRTKKPASHPGRLALGVACALAVSSTGCSQLRVFRGSEPPKVADLMAGPAGDPYLVHNRGGTTGKNDPAAAQGESGASSVRTTVHPTSASRADEEGQVPTEIVTLQPPVALPTASRPHPGATATGESGASMRDPIEEGRAVVAKARANLNAMRNYRVQINRQERVGDSLQPAEDFQLSVRREPKAVRLEWPTGSHKGREVLYSASEPGGMLHVHMADTLVPVPTISLSPDSPMVMKNSRHPITEAGFDAIVTTLERGVSGTPDGSRTSYEGMETPAAVGRPCHKIERHNAAGETWLFYLDSGNSLPAMVQGTAASGELLERYVFHDVKPDLAELATAEAFDPAKRWGGGGLLGRLARSGGGDAKANATQAPR